MISTAVLSRKTNSLARSAKNLATLPDWVLLVMFLLNLSWYWKLNRVSSIESLNCDRVDSYLFMKFTRLFIVLYRSFSLDYSAVIWQKALNRSAFSFSQSITFLKSVMLWITWLPAFSLCCCKLNTPGVLPKWERSIVYSSSASDLKVICNGPKLNISSQSPWKEC